MGLLLSRFRRKTKNAEEQLEDLTKKIQQIKEFQECEEDKLRLRVRQLVIYSSIIYVFILVIYFILDPESGKKYYLLILILFPVIIFAVRRLIIMYFKRKITKNKVKVEIYKKEKQKILDDVKETETYKVAKRILEKYEVPLTSHRFTPPRVSTPIPIPKPTSGAVTPYQSSAMNTDLRRRTSFFNQSSQLLSAPRVAPTLVRPIVTENKGVFDRILQKVVGDGPNERYALICKACGNHNGMALEEEFEFLSYRCAFCSFFNPARKQRVAMQTVLMQNLNLIALKNTSDSDSGDDRKGLEITELEESESESKEVKSEELSSQNKIDNAAKKVVVEETSTLNEEEKQSEPVIVKTEGKNNSITHEELQKASKETTSDENKENEHSCCESNSKEVVYDEEKGKYESGENTDPQIESQSKIVVKKNSPMEVDEDQTSITELDSSVKKLSLES